MSSYISDAISTQKVAIYIRVSTAMQIDKDSLQVQKRELTAYSEMVLGIKDYVIFEDPGYSAKNTDRPDYQRMMERLRTGEFSHLLVWKIDRISRNLLDFAQMYAELKRLGVAFVSKNEQFDTSSAIGEAMLKIILVFAELERNMTSEHVTAVMLSRANNGQWNGGRVPYGYKWDKEAKEFSLIESEAKIVRTIYDMYEEYQSLAYICRWLNENNYPTKNGKEWSITTIHKILTNPFYNGSYLYNVYKDGKAVSKRKPDDWIVFEDHHIAIVTVERFDRIQFLLKRNRRGGVPETESYVRKNIHIFAGITKCGVCGALMSATLDKRRADGWRPSIYGCSRRRKNSSVCSNKYVSDAALGPFVFNYVANIIRAKNSGKKYSPETLGKKLLQGTAFFSVDHIGASGLEQLSDLLARGESGLEYKPSYIVEETNAKVSEYEMLREKHRKLQTAMNRLQTVFLYNEAETPPTEFILEREKITSEMSAIEKRMTELGGEAFGDKITDESFLKKASYFIMVEKLLDAKNIDYEKYIRGIDEQVPRNFILSIIERIDVTDGCVSAITFKNGMKHEFFYKEQ